MIKRAANVLLQRLIPLRRRSRPAAFQLTRYFTATSLLAFAILALALYVLERGEQQFFGAVQRDQNAFFAQVQAQLLLEQKEAARSNLLSVHEAGHVTLTNLFANALWASRFAPLVSRAQSISMEPCRRAGSNGTANGSAGQAQAQQACIAKVRGQVTSLPGFEAADSSARALMRKTAVFKIKVYDLRGLTVYSSELGQIGEDKSDNAGWRSAIAGKPATELVHRNRFSAFEGVMENRDLIESYVPVVAPDGGINGVFEIYSDVTPLLQQIAVASARIGEAAARNQARVEEAATKNQRTVESASTKLLLIVGGLLIFIYAALLFFVRNGQRIIDEEARARERSALREQQWHRDKMATMAAMAANMSHEVGNPLAIISGLAQEIALWRDASELNAEAPRMILEQTSRIADMTRRITEFASSGPETPEPLDLNQLIRVVCDFLAFDKRFRGTPIELRLGDHLPACQGIPHHLTEVLMGLLLALEEACETCPRRGNRIVVQSKAQGAELLVRIGCDCSERHEGCGVSPTDSRLESARRRLEDMGGRIESADTGLEMRLASVETGETLERGSSPQ
jgi:signal transduction histidine kinase